VEHVLSQPPVQGRSAIAALETEIASEYFPKDRDQAAAVLRGTALLNANDALVRGVIDALIFGYATPAHAVYGKIQVGVALDVLLDLHRARAEERIASQLSKVIRNVGDADFPLVARLVASMNEAPALVNEAARIRLAEFLRTGPLAEIEKTVSGLARHPELATAAATRIATLDNQGAGPRASGRSSQLRPRELDLPAHGDAIAGLAWPSRHRTCHPHARRDWRRSDRC